MSNSAARIADLRRQITADKGKAKRARAMAEELTHKAYDCERRIRSAQAEIESMGGKVKR